MQRSVLVSGRWRIGFALLAAPEQPIELSMVLPNSSVDWRGPKVNPRNHVVTDAPRVPALLHDCQMAAELRATRLRNRTNDNLSVQSRSPDVAKRIADGSGDIFSKL